MAGAAHTPQTTCLSPYRRLRQGATRAAPSRLSVCPHTAPFDHAADPNGFSRAAADAVGVGRREVFGVRQLAAALFSFPNNVSVPLFPISPMTGHATRFDPANRATEHTPAGCGEESPRSCRRVGGNTDGRERGRPRPHQRYDRPYDPFGSRKCGARTFTGCGCPNNVSVPILASEGFLYRLRQPPIGTRNNLRTMPQAGGKTQTTSLSHYTTHPRRRSCCDRPTYGQRSRYRETEQTRGVRIFAN